LAPVSASTRLGDPEARGEPLHGRRSLSPRPQPMVNRDRVHPAADGGIALSRGGAHASGRRMLTAVTVDQGLRPEANARRRP